ncbi:exonuclease domain-containing protein [Ochrobactrum quorumnocens]|uniref:exonuclease domain-containing protein n=1 Tax=Ochrobactrum quorumnocens TaxID=271865 RepID=UPI003BA2D275
MTGNRETGTPHASERIRVIDLETAGNGRTDVCEIGWQDVARNADGRWALTEQRGARFVNPGRAISAETMAIHHIVDAQVADAPHWKDIAPQILRNAAVGALAAHRAAFEQRYCTPQLTGGLPFICTWKCALRLWPELPRFSNQMLRYQRMPKGLVHELGLPAHRALPDAYVTAHHLRDMLNTASLNQLLAWSAEPGLLPRVPSGPDRGKGWDRISAQTLNAFLQDRDDDIRFSARTELIRRGERPAPASLEPQQGSLL